MCYAVTSRRHEAAQLRRQIVKPVMDRLSETNEVIFSRFSVCGMRPSTRLPGIIHCSRLF